MYGDTTSPTAKMTSVKILLQLAAARNYHYGSIDVTAAYLHADIDRDIYISIPDPNDLDSRVYAKLQKSESLC
jgi:hypothetical protein